MKKNLLLLVVFVLGLNYAASAQVYQTEREAAGAAKAICGEFGQNAKGGTADNHTGAIKYGSTSTRENSTTGAQNNTRIQGGVNAGTRNVSGNASASYERTGEQENSKNESKRENSGYLYYRCED